MHINLQTYLIKKFPKLYIDNPDNKRSVDFYFECDDGWFRLILWLSRYLQLYVDKQNTWSKKYPDMYQPIEQIKVIEVKEKFGILRYNVINGNSHTESIIQFAEFISGCICEYTGKTEDVGYNKLGWVKSTHISKSHTELDFNYIDDEELRKILKTI